MTTPLESLAAELATLTTKTGATFAAEVAGETLKVSCSSNPDAVIYLAASDEQILSVTPLFPQSDIQQEKRTDFNEMLLRLSPVLPLTSVGLQGDQYILFGAMAVGTLMENIAYELECQVNNYDDVMVALSEYLTTEN